MGATKKKKNTRKYNKEELTWPHSLQGNRGWGELINDIQLTATCNCEKAESQVEKEDQ